jgi:hypothetical protein
MVFGCTRGSVMADNNSIGELFTDMRLLLRVNIFDCGKGIGSRSSGSNDMVVLGIALDLKAR